MCLNESVFQSVQCSGRPTGVEIAPALPSTTRCATQRSAPVPMRISGLSSASRGATSTTTTSSTPGYPMSTRMVSWERPHLTGWFLFVLFFFVFFLYRGPKMWAELQIKGDGRGGLHEPGDARWDPLQLLGPFQRVRTWRVSGMSSFLFRAFSNHPHMYFQGEYLRN